MARDLTGKTMIIAGASSGIVALTSCLADRWVRVARPGPPLVGADQLPQAGSHAPAHPLRRYPDAHHAPAGTNTRNQTSYQSTKCRERNECADLAGILGKGLPMPFTQQRVLEANPP